MNGIRKIDYAQQHPVNAVAVNQGKRRVGIDMGSIW